TIKTSCLSTTPTANLGVARASGMPGTPTCTATPTDAVKGFPGDGFVLTNQSSSGTTLEELVITGPSQYYENVTGSMLGGSTTWTSPTHLTGTFTATLKVRDASQNLLTATGSVYLCGDPVSRLTLTHVKAPGGSWQACTSCSWLQGYGLRLSTLTSDGHPAWGSANPAWTVQLCPTGAGCTVAPTADYVNNGNGTLELTLNSTGDYKVGAAVSYPFLQLPVATSVVTVHSGAVTAAFTATQGSTTVTNGGTAMIGSPLNLTFTGQVASGSTATCSWALTPNAWSAASVPCSSGATIPADTLTNGQQYTLQLTAVSAPAVDQAVASLTFTASDISGSFSWTPSTVNIGTLVSFMGEGLPSNVQKARWSFGETGCTGYASVIEGTCTLGCVTGFRFKSAGTKTVTLAISMDGTSYTTIASQQLTVNNTGTCPTSCTGPGTPNASSPKNTTVPAGTVTFQWTTVSGTSPITYDVYVEFAKVCSSSGNSCTSTTQLAAGSYSWTVKASNACGSATSAQASFTVGSACTMPTAPTNISPAHQATVPAGNVTFTWTASSGSPTPTYDLYVGLVKKASGLTGTSHTTAVANGGPYPWLVTARNSCGSASSTATNVTVGEPCVAPGQPTNPTPADNGVVPPGNVTLTWAAPATGNSLTYDVYVGGVRLCQGITTRQCVVPSVTSGERTWYVKALNSCGTGTSPTWKFSVCQATAVPVASFTWEPKDQVTIGGVVQDQPYVGQAVTFDPSGTTNFPTSYEWTDFSQSPWATYTVANPTHTWQTPGDKIVRMKATNCIGTSAQVPLTVKVFPDMRPVIASFTSNVADAQNPQVVTFNAATGATYGDPNYYIWDFGDGETASGSDKAEVVHTFRCGRTFPVKLISRRIKSGSDVKSQAATRDVTVGGSQCSPQSLMVMDVARNLPGNNGALWNTDLTLYNPTENDMDLRLAVKRPDASPREESGTFTLPAGQTRSLEWVLSKVEIEFSKASLWFYQADPVYRGVKPLPIISARTHTGAVAPYDDFGQFVMVYQVYQATNKKLTLYFTGLRHNGKTAQTSGQGFRTNVTIVEPAGVGWAADDVKLTLSKADDPTFVKERQLWASGKYGYWQKSLDSFFTDLTPEDDLGQVILKVEIEPGAAIALGSSLVNNGTNAPVFVPAQEAP
ncbi:MAG: PKD domain-containing protein, partial [Thermoanaerobaculaceae bacterium]|nr:PKD domain-containing protein [Thermoanaerobaculaceae bacterium]